MSRTTVFTTLQRKWLWEFVRGDVNRSDFEKWLYNDATLENELGSDTYNELVWCNFDDNEETYRIKKLLRPVLEEEDCHCASVRNLDGIEMGGDWFFKKFFATLTEVTKPQTEQWWLSIFHCEVCATNWLVAQEERIHDMFYVQRVSEQVIRDTENGNWPKEFQTYGDVLDAGVKLGCRQACFVDPMPGALQITVDDLLKETPEISAHEIGEKLGISPEHAAKLVFKVINDGADPMAGFIQTR